MTETRPVLRYSCLAAAFAATMAVTSRSQAAFTLVDNFPQANGTALNGTTSANGGTWGADSVTVQGGAAQWAVGAANKRTELTLPISGGIAEGNTGTLFFQLTPSGSVTVGVGDNADNNIANPLAALQFNFGAPRTSFSSSYSDRVRHHRLTSEPLKRRGPRASTGLNEER